MKRKFTVQHNNLSEHTPKSTKHRLNQKKVSVSDRSSLTYDLNPAKHLWVDPRQSVYRKWHHNLSVEESVGDHCWVETCCDKKYQKMFGIFQCSFLGVQTYANLWRANEFLIISFHETSSAFKTALWWYLLVKTWHCSRKTLNSNHTHHYCKEIQPHNWKCNFYIFKILFHSLMC